MFRGIRVLQFSLGVFLFLACAGRAHAQYRAAIQGTVTDASGAVVLGAQVTATHSATGRQYQAATSEEGFFRIPALPPGKYTVTVELKGFKTQQIQEVMVSAEDTTGLSISLDVGAVESVVTVAAEAAAVQTENANISKAITNEEILRLPQVGRDPYELLRLTPGVFGNGARSGAGNSIGLPNTTGPGGSNNSIFQVENQVPISANGQRLSANNYQVDGVSVNSLGHGGAAVVTPNQESVQEIRVVSTTYSAEDGRNTGAQIKVVSKSGSNDYHGSAFIKYNDPDLNSFNSYGGLNNAPPQRVSQLLRQFGASIGGPVLEERLFFFFSYEGLRRNASDFFSRFVETPEYRSAIASMRSATVTNRVLSDPGAVPRIATVLSATCGTLPATQCAAVSGGLDIGSITGAPGSYVTAAEGGGLDGVPDLQFAQIQVPSFTRGNQYNFRVDYNRSHDQFAVSTYFTSRNDQFADLGAQGRPGADLRAKPLNQAVTLLWNRTLTSTMLNEARFNFTRFAFNDEKANSGSNFGLPRVEVEGLALLTGERVRFSAPRSETTPGIFAQNTFEFRDTFSKTWGPHGMKAGGEILWEQNNNNLRGGSRPVYSFVGLWNLANDTPIFEAINTDPATGAPVDAQRYFRTRTYALFFQDDWKFRPNLTFNLGLRWEYFTPLREAGDRITNLILASPTTLVGASVQLQDELYEPDRNNFAPRLGFAWSPGLFSQKMVLRGGFGVGFNRSPGVLFGNNRGNPPFFARNSLCCGTAADPFAGGRILYATGSSNSAASYPVNPALALGIDPTDNSVIGSIVEVWGTPGKVPNAYVYNFSLEGEYQLPQQWVATLGYQGSSSHKLIRIVSLRLFLPQPTPPLFNPVFFIQPDTTANFHAMNARISRPFSQGYSLEASYRWSKSMDTLSFEGPGAETNQTNPGDLASEYGPSDFDTTHYLVVSALWDLPIARDRNDWVGKAFGGWQISGIFTAHTGFPWTPKRFVDLRQPSGAFFGPTRPTSVLMQAGDNHGDQAFTSGSTVNNFPGGGSLFFDATTMGPPGIGRNSFRGPRYGNLDMSLFKRTKLPNMPFFGENGNIELRFNFFNFLNLTNLEPIRFFQAGSIITNTNFGRSERGLAGRVIELQARFSF
ncbi:MAG: TonB-dependent receptor [Acidobacteria bacterium]|nr:TonB-dependent receptor [Acidobacteriota bacterium]